MKIDCPHCGVHGSVGDYLIEKKLRCPECSKVFLVTDDMLPEAETAAVVHRESLYDAEPEGIETIEVEEVVEQVEVIVPEAVSDFEEPVDDFTTKDERPELLLVSDDEASEEALLEIMGGGTGEGWVATNEAGNLLGLMAGEDEGDFDEGHGELQPCFSCGEAFRPDFLVAVGSRKYCALCAPEKSEVVGNKLKGLPALPTENNREVELYEEAPPLSTGEKTAAEIEFEIGDDLLGLMDEEDEGDFDEDHRELQPCFGCGEEFHPAFLEVVNFRNYCALCVPERSEVEPHDDDPLLSTDEKTDVEPDNKDMEVEWEDSLLDLVDHDAAVEAETDIPDPNEEAVKEPCAGCGKIFERDFLQEIDAKLYCGVCQIEVNAELSESEESKVESGAVVAGVAAGAAAAVAALGGDSETDEEEKAAGSDSDFTIRECIKEAWRKTKGVKASIWGGTIVMSLIVFCVVIGGGAAVQSFYKGEDPVITEGMNSVLQVVTSWLSSLMTGGLMLIGVRHVLKRRVSWKMVFAGFSQALSITMALILQTVLVCIGFILLVLPGIYLSVGYSLALPLILDKGMGAWEALEASRKAIHKKWWTVFGLYLVMLVLFVVALIPLGLGLIWIVPLHFVLIGVLYAHLFESGKGVEETQDDESETEAQEEHGDETEE